MRQSIIIILLLTINVVVAQKLRLPKKPYVIVIGKDTLLTRTVIEKAPPGDYENYTLENKAVYGNVDSLRVWTYLLKNEKYSITFPTRIDSLLIGPCCQPPPPPMERHPFQGVEVKIGDKFVMIDTTGRDINKLLTHGELIWLDTTDHIDVNKLVGTIAGDKLRKLLNAETRVYYGTQKLHVRQTRVMLVGPNGKTAERDCEGSRIGKCFSSTDELKTIQPKGHLVIERIWFYNEKNKPHGIDDKIAWRIE